MQVRREHVIGAQQPLHTHGRGDVGRRHQTPEIVDGQAQHPEHAVGAVDESQTLLLLQLDRLDASVEERIGRLHHLPVDSHGPLTHQGEGTVRERREITGAPQRAELVHDRRDPRVEQGRIRGDHDGPHPRAPGGQGLDAQQHERADDLLLDLRARARGVRAHQGALQLAAQLHRDVPGRQGAKARRDAVVGSGVVGQRLDDLAAPGDRLECLGGQGHAGAVPRDSRDLVDAQRPRSHDDHIAGLGRVH